MEIPMALRLLVGCSLFFALLSAGFAEAAEPPASIKLLRADISVQDDGTFVRTLHVETAVNNDDAARSEAQQQLAFSDGLERVELLNAYTLKPDGKRIQIQPDAIRIQLAPGVPNLPMYSDRKVMVGVLPDVAGGDVLVVDWRQTAIHPAFPGQFTQTSTFPRTVPWDRFELTITTPLDKPLQTETHGPAFEQADEGGRHVYRWMYSAAALPSEHLALSLLDRAPRLFASTFPSWPALSKAYAGQFAPAIAITPRIEALADEVTAGNADPREQARRLYEWVSLHVRWVALYLGNGTFVPHSAAEVLANGYGDCKDQVALLVALLHAKGIAAEPVLINLGPTYTLSQPATLTAFNHVITYLPNWHIYADTTPGGAPFGTLPFSEYGKPILHVTAEGAAPDRLPVLAAGAASLRLVTTTTLTADGAVAGASTNEGIGPYATLLRMVIRASRAQGSEQFGTAQLSRDDEPAQGTVIGPEKDAMGLDYVAKGQFTFEPQPGWLEGNTFQVPWGMRLLASTGDALIGPVKDRHLPVSEPTPCYAGTQIDDFSLEVPPGYTPIHLPKDASAKGSFFDYQSHWAFTDGKVTVHRSLVSTIDQPVCEGAQRAEAAAALATIRKDQAAELGLEKAE